MRTFTSTDALDLFRRPPHRFLDVGAGEVAHRSVGTGPDVLFVHGWPVSGATFRRLLPHLVDHVTCHLIDLPGSGSSRFAADTPLSVGRHIESVRRVVDLLDLEQVAVVGHDSGGLIARHALAGDPRVVGMGLIDTEQPQGLSWRFRRLLAGRHAPGFGAALGRLAGARRLRRTGPAFGDAFADPSMLDGEFDELFLRPLADDPARLAAAVRVLQSFDVGAVLELGRVHRRITVPVRLVWGEQDKFFPVQWAREMVDTFPHATLTVVPGAGLFCHEERPAEVARALVEVVDAATGVR